MGIVAEAGFADIAITKEKVFALPDSVLSKFLSPSEIIDYQQSDVTIVSITVYGEKPTSSHL